MCDRWLPLREQNFFSVPNMNEAQSHSPERPKPVSEKGGSPATRSTSLKQQRCSGAVCVPAAGFYCKEKWVPAPLPHAQSLHYERTNGFLRGHAQLKPGRGQKLTSGIPPEI